MSEEAGPQDLHNRALYCAEYIIMDPAGRLSVIGIFQTFKPLYRETTSPSVRRP